MWRTSVYKWTKIGSKIKQSERGSNEFIFIDKWFAKFIFKCFWPKAEGQEKPQEPISAENKLKKIELALEKIREEREERKRKCEREKESLK